MHGSRSLDYTFVFKNDQYYKVRINSSEDICDWGTKTDNIQGLKENCISSWNPISLLWESEYTNMEVEITALNSN